MSAFDGTLRSDRSWRFDADPDTVWAAIGSTGAYRSWWPWLRSFGGEDGLVDGGVWTCRVAPPVPYQLRFEVRFVDVVAPVSVSAEVAGDIEGVAELTLDGDDDGTVARLHSQLRPANLLLRSVNATAPFVARRGHDWILDRGSQQFRARALGETDRGS